jgi:LacI family transcriptional regulator
MTPTMEDVARRAEVAKSTVSLVLNDKPGVSPALKDVVLQAAAELGYHQPKHRFQRRSNTNRTIAVVHAQSNPKLDGNSEPTDLYLNYLHGIRSFAQTANVNLTVIADYHEEDTRQLAFHLLHNSTPAFDGLIVMGGSAHQNSQLMHQIIENEIPAVALSRHWPNLPISTVGPNYQQQVRIALDYLTGLGHRQIAFLASENDRRFDWYQWRLDCYQEAMREINGEVDEELVATGSNGAEAVIALIKRRPDVTAIFAINDERALEALQGLPELGLRTPQDLSIIGQDNVVELMGDKPTLTTVGFPHAEVGYLATELLLKQLQNNAISYCNLWVQCSLVERSSCGRPARER